MTSLRLRSLSILLIAVVWAYGVAWPAHASAQQRQQQPPARSGPRIELAPPDMPLIPSTGQPGTRPTAGAAASNVEADPIRCWWRTTTGAVRTGETFSLVLTCAVIENEAVQIVPDESRLGSSVIQMAPFEVVSGLHPADQRSQNRRFFQYEYTLRMINPDFIGKDVRVPDLVIHYRVNSRLAGNASVQGRDLIYGLPTIALRVLAMVPADAIDIRDTPNETFASIESLAFRASLLRIVAITLLALGVLVALLSLVRVFTRTRRTTKIAEHGISTGAVLGLAARELAAVQDESQQGWGPPLVDRALAASRIVAACALDGKPSQRIAAGKVSAGEGQLVRPLGRGRTAVVWSRLTADDIRQRLSSLSESAAPDRRQLLEHLQTALAALTETLYARPTSGDQPSLANASSELRPGDDGRASLDAVLAHVVEAAQTLKGEHAWPRPLLRRWSGRTAEPERRT
jgi:hypothetical protein